jgi:hypothetical protein
MLRYFINENGQTKGPFTIQQLCSMWHKGTITSETLYCEEGFEGWLHLRVLEEQLESPELGTKPADGGAQRQISGSLASPPSRPSPYSNAELGEIAVAHRLWNNALGCSVAATLVVAGRGALERFLDPKILGPASSILLAAAVVFYLYAVRRMALSLKSENPSVWLLSTALWIGVSFAATPHINAQNWTSYAHWSQIVAWLIAGLLPVPGILYLKGNNVLRRARVSVGLLGLSKKATEDLTRGVAGMTSPPPLPSPAKKLRLAGELNLFMPGAGLFYLGQRKVGLALAMSFLTCFVTAMGMFLAGYARYIALVTSDQILEGDRIEQIGRAIPTGWLVGLAIVGTAIYLCSMILFGAAKRKLALTQGAR